MLLGWEARLGSGAGQALLRRRGPELRRAPPESGGGGASGEGSEEEEGPGGTGGGAGRLRGASLGWWEAGPGQWSCEKLAET